MTDRRDEKPAMLLRIVGVEYVEKLPTRRILKDSHSAAGNTRQSALTPLSRSFSSWPTLLEGLNTSSRSTLKLKILHAIIYAIDFVANIEAARSGCLCNLRLPAKCSHDDGHP